LRDLTPENIGPSEPPKLYSPKQVVGAAFLGSPIAGGIVMAANFRAFGDDARAKVTMQISAALTIIVFILAYYLPERTPSSLLPAAYCGAFLWYANKYQLKRFERHIEAGGPQQSNWRVAGIGIACLIAVLAALFALILMFPDWFPE
jgi:hypothetical protein